jgi:hypothetical protein
MGQYATIQPPPMMGCGWPSRGEAVVVISMFVFAASVVRKKRWIGAALGAKLLQQ